MLMLGALGARGRVFCFAAEARQLVLANAQFEAETGQFVLHVLVTMRGREEAALGFTLLVGELFERLLGIGHLGGDLGQRSLRAAHFLLEAKNLAVERAQLALHAQRASFIGAATSDHATLIAGAVRRDKGILRIVAS